MRRAFQTQGTPCESAGPSDMKRQSCVQNAAEAARLHMAPMVCLIGVGQFF